MKSSELRPYNYVILDGELQQVVDIRTDIVLLKYNDVYTSSLIDSLSPIPSSEEWLIDLGFTKNPSKIINSYSIDVSWYDESYKVLSLTLDKGNQYIYVREGDKDGDRSDDDIICIHNGDLHGDILIHKIQNIYYLFTNKELHLKTEYGNDF
jgi:hypothetical protein